MENGILFKRKEKKMENLLLKNKHCPFLTGIVAHMFNSNQNVMSKKKITQRIMIFGWGYKQQEQMSI